MCCVASEDNMRAILAAMAMVAATDAVQLKARILRLLRGILHTRKVLRRIENTPIDAWGDEEEGRMCKDLAYYFAWDAREYFNKVFGLENAHETIRRDCDRLQARLEQHRANRATRGENAPAPDVTTEENMEP